MQRRDTERRTPSRRRLLRGIAAGGAATLTAGTAAAQSAGGGEGGEQVQPDFGGWLDGVEGGYRDARGEDSVTVLVGAQGNGGAYAFSPAGLWIDPGTTVQFRWTGEGGGHNVVGNDGPASSMNSGDPVAESGVNFEHTFEDGGITSYYCEPHRSLGMKGAVAVGDEVPTKAVAPPGGGEQGPGYWQRPEALLAVLIYGGLGLAAGGVLAAEGYSELQARGGLRGPEPESTGPAAEAEEAEPAVELEHDEYDPTGTATLILLYFAVLVLMWVFMYFVEFLGNGPTVIG